MPRYFERDVHEIIAKDGPDFTQYFCALRGQQVRPLYKDGGWIPLNHVASPKIDNSPF